MFDFLEDMKDYVSNVLNEDADIPVSKKPEVYNSYQKQHEPSTKKPEVQIRILDNSENVDYTTFCGTNASNIPLQFSIYTPQFKIGGVDRSALHCSIILADKLNKYLNNLIYGCSNANIYGGRLVSTSPALPMDETGTLYVTALRFDFTIADPYSVG